MNGWSNRATWLVFCWYNPQDANEVDLIRDMLEEQYDAMPNGIMRDLIDLREIDWEELKDAVEEDE